MTPKYRDTLSWGLNPRQYEQDALIPERFCLDLGDRVP